MPEPEQTNPFCHSPPHPHGLRHHFSPVARFWLPNVSRSGQTSSLSPALAKDKDNGDRGQVPSGPSPLLMLREGTLGAGSKEQRCTPSELLPSRTSFTHQHCSWCQAQLWAHVNPRALNPCPDTALPACHALCKQMGRGSSARAGGTCAKRRQEMNSSAGRAHPAAHRQPV